MRNLFEYLVLILNRLPIQMKYLIIIRDWQFRSFVRHFVHTFTHSNLTNTTTTTGYLTR